MNTKVDSWASYPLISNRVSLESVVLTANGLLIKAVVEANKTLGMPMPGVFGCGGDQHFSAELCEQVRWVDGNGQPDLNQSPGSSGLLEPLLYIYEVDGLQHSPQLTPENAVLIEVGRTAVALRVKVQDTALTVVEFPVAVSFDRIDNALVQAEQAALVKNILCSELDQSLLVSRVFKTANDVPVIHYKGLVTGPDGLTFSNDAPLGVDGANGIPHDPVAFSDCLNGLTIPLNDYEYAFIGTHPMEMLAHFNVPNNKEILAVLENNITECLKHFDLFNSRLVSIDDGYYLQHDNSDLAFAIRPEIHWDTDAFDLRDIGDYLQRVKSLPGERLFLATITPTQSGVLFGVSLSHILGDGASLASFNKSVMSILLGAPAILPSRKRSFYQSGKRLPNSLGRSIGDGAVEGSDGGHSIEDLMGNERYFFDREISGDEMKFLLTHYGAGLTAPLHSVLSAYALKEYMAYFYRDTDTIRLRTACDLRERFPGVDKNYLGNAFIDVVVEFSYLEFNKMDVAEVAQRIDRCMCLALTEERINEGFEMTEHGVCIVNQSGQLGSGFNPDTDIVGSGVVASDDPDVVQMMQPDIVGPFFSAHKGFLMYEKEGVRHLVVVSDRPFPSTQKNEGVAEEFQEDELLAY